MKKSNYTTEVYEYVRDIYQNSIRTRTPISDNRREYNGVVVKPFRTSDRFSPLSLAPNQGGHKLPEKYEFGIVNQLKSRVSPGDDVTIIGGGLGVSAIVAARMTGEKGSVTVYEGSGSMVEHLQETIKINEVPTKINVHHAIVGNAMRLDGASFNAPTVSPSEISECDVLEMDCEGAELDILPNLSICPELLIIETHGNKPKVVNILEDSGYEIIQIQLAESGPYEEMCEENEIKVLTAKST